MAGTGATPAPRPEIEQQTLEYLATMPAWRDHLRVTASRPSRDS